MFLLQMVQHLTINQFVVQANGSLALNATPTVANNGTGPRAIIFNPTNPTSLVVANNSTNVSSFSMNVSNGTLTLQSSNAGTNGAYGLAFDPSGQYLYVASSGSSLINEFIFSSANGNITTNSSVGTGSNVLWITVR